MGRVVEVRIMSNRVRVDRIGRVLIGKVRRLIFFVLRRILLLWRWIGVLLRGG